MVFIIPTYSITSMSPYTLPNISIGTFKEFLSMDVSLMCTVSRPAASPAVSLIFASVPVPVYPTESTVEISSIDPAAEFIVSKKIDEFKSTVPSVIVVTLILEKG